MKAIKILIICACWAATFTSIWTLFVYAGFDRVWWVELNGSPMRFVLLCVFHFLGIIAGPVATENLK